jgi:F-type H+-transporting ATPase subunit epsilon
MSEQTPTIRLLVMTPDRIALDERVTAIRFQEPDGWRGILVHHAPYLTRLTRGALLYRPASSDEPQYLALYGGTLEVQEDTVLVLTGAAEPGRDLDELAQRLSEEKAEADALAFEAYIEFTKVRTALVRALTDLPAAPETIR